MAGRQWQRTCDLIDPRGPINRWPLIVLVDDSECWLRTKLEQLCVGHVYTQQPGSGCLLATELQQPTNTFQLAAAWSCDARVKPHHAPPLLEDPQVTAKVDALATKNLPISRYL